MKRSLWWGGLLVSAGMFLGSVVVPAVTGARAAQGGNPQIPKVVRAQKFELRNEEGEGRAVLGLASDGTLGLVLCDEKGKVRAQLDLDADGLSRLALRDANGETRTGLIVNPDGSPSLGLLDEKGEGRAMVMVLPDGSPRLSIHDEKGKSRVELGVTELETTKTGETRKTAESSVVLFDKEGKVMWKAPPG